MQVANSFTLTGPKNAPSPFSICTRWMALLGLFITAFPGLTSHDGYAAESSLSDQPANTTPTATDSRAPLKETPTYVEGKLLCTNGQPAAGAEVTLILKSKGLWEPEIDKKNLRPFASGRSNEDGVFQFTEVPPGRYQLISTTTGYAGSSEYVSPGYRKERLLTFLLRPAQIIHGRVTDERLNPLSDVATESVFPSVTYWSFTRPDGTFDAIIPKGWRQGPCRDYEGLVYLKQGFAPTVLTQDLSDTPLNVVLGKGCAISGRITLDGKPVPGIKVVSHAAYYLLQSCDSDAAVSDNNGRYRIERLGAGKHIAAVENDHYRADKWSGVIAEQSQEMSGVDFTLSPKDPGVIKVTVTDKETGAPMQNVSISLNGIMLKGDERQDNERDWLTEHGLRHGKTDPDGQFSFTGLPLGVYEISPDVYENEMNTVTKDHTVTDLYLGEGEETTVRFELHRGATATVFLRDEAGKPVSGAYTCTQNGFDEVAPGEYKMRGLPLGVFSPRPTRFGLFLTSRPKADIETYNDSPVLTMTMNRGLSMCGKVIDPDGNAVAGAIIKSATSNYWEDFTSGAFAVTDEDGEFPLEGFACADDLRERYWRCFDMDGKLGTLWGPLPVLTICPEFPRPESPLTETTHTLSGKVVNELGQAMAKVQITAGNSNIAFPWPKTETDDAGRFRFTGLPNGSVKLTALSTRCEMHGEEVVSKVDCDDVEIKMVRYAHISGTVLDKATGAAPPIVLLDVVSQRPEYAPGSKAKKIGTNGTFAMNVVPNAELKVTAKAKGYMVSAPVKMTLKPDETAPNLVFELVKAGNIAGTVRDKFTNAPVSKAVVYERRYRYPDNPGFEFGSLFKVAETNTDGQFRIAGIDHSPVELNVLCKGYAAETVSDIQVESGTTIDVNMLLGVGGTIKGHIYGADGALLPNVPVFLHDRIPYKQDSSGPDGAYEFKRVIPGEVKVGIIIRVTPTLSRNYKEYKKTVPIRDGETLNVDFRPDDPHEEGLSCERE